MNLPSVGIAIPCFQEALHIEECVLSCLNQTYRGLIKVYVADGGSTDGTLEKLKQLALQHEIKIVVLKNERRVTPVALNMGLQASQEDFKMILGAHAALPSDYIEKCLQTFEENPEAYCVGGIIINEYQDATSQAIGCAMSSSFGVGNAHFRTGNKNGFVDTVAFGMYRKEVFEKIGYFREELIRNQDDEFNFRMEKNGMKCYLNTDLHSKYYVRGTLSKLMKQYYQYGYWKVYVNILHGQITTVRQLVPFAFVCHLIIFVFTNIFFPKYDVYLGIPILAYFILALIFAGRAKSKEPRVTLLSFFILHLGYGWGYLRGLIEMKIFGKRPSLQNAQHNR
jgi:cellulose synthase/poly-beta-1,6-N-acetylglucosamine synthase-like glycosyltransferase